MRKVLILVLWASLASARAVYAYDDGDFQIWNTDTQEIKTGKAWAIVLEEEFRWGKNAGEFYYQHYDLGFSRPLDKRWNAGLGFRQIYELKQAKFKPEQAPYFWAGLSWQAGGCKWENRGRLEYRDFNYQSDSWRYRDKLTVKLPGTFTARKIQPYLADEIFYSFGGGTNKLNQNRSSVGLAFVFAKWLKADVYYMLVRAEAGEKWKNSNVLGTKFKMVF